MNKLFTCLVVGALLVTSNAANAAVLIPVKKPVPHQTNCADEMGFMRGVNRADIEAIDDQSVMIIPVCESGSLIHNDDYGSLFVDGNVNAVRGPIAHNRTLMSALLSKDYDQNDVVSLRFGGNNSIVVYVHQRNMR